MKLAAYAIAGNEAVHVKGWLESTQQADVRVVAVDPDAMEGETAKLLREAGVDVRPLDIAAECQARLDKHGVKGRPWLFDAARNKVLSWIPEDVDACLALDMDERVEPDWTTKVKNAWRGDVNGVYSDFVQGHYPDGSPAVRFVNMRIHARHGWIWRYPAHECVMPEKEGTEVRPSSEWVRIDHWQTPGRTPRDDWYLYELIVKEMPDDARAQHYYARELFNHKKYDEAIEAFKKHLAMPKSEWKQQRAGSMWMIAHICEVQAKLITDALAKAKEPAKPEVGAATSTEPQPTAADAAKKITDAREWWMRSMLEWPCRESWINLSRHLTQNGAPDAGYWAARVGCQNTERMGDYLTHQYYWMEGPYDALGGAAMAVGRILEAKQAVTRAMNIRPSDDRIYENYRQLEPRVSMGGPGPALMILSRLPKNGPVRGVEVGVFSGETSERLLAARPDLMLYMVDKWSPNAIEAGGLYQTMDRSQWVVALNLARVATEPYAYRRIIIDASSLQAADLIADQSLDFAFLDADHSETALRADICAWGRKIKPGGLLCGHDADRETVVAVVNTIGAEIVGAMWFKRL